MQRPQKSSSILILALLAALSAHAETDCGPCADEIAKMRKSDAEIQRLKGLLGKNDEYLTQVDPKALSKFIKVRSNKLQILEKMDREKRALDALQSEIVKKGCEPCLKESQDG